MIGRWAERRVIARAAVAGLAAGLTALSTLAVWGIDATNATTARVRSCNRISDRWNSVFTHLNTEDALLTQFTSSDGGQRQRAKLIAAIGSAGEDLAWLERNGGPSEAGRARALQVDYADYTRVIRTIATHTGGRDQMTGLSKLAGQDFAALRDQAVANIERKQRELASDLRAARERSVTLRWIAVVVVAIDLLLCTISTLALIIYQRHTEQEAASSRHKALHDSLTGLANRQMLAEEIEAAIGRPQQDGRAVGLLLIDLDRFKGINDTLGHHCGDLLLREVAQRLTTASRRTDTVARLGGDEFAILLPGLPSAENLQTIAREIRRVVQEPFEMNGLMIDFGVSIGTALYPTDASTAEDLLKHTDMAMYAAKQGGFGVMAYDPRRSECEMGGLGHDPTILLMLGELRRGIGNGELLLHYQPKVDTATGDLFGVEALVRWQHPRRGLLSAADFLPRVKDSDLSSLLSREVLRMVIEQSRRWLAAGRRIPIAVNVTAKGLLDLDLSDQIAELCQRHGVPADLLTVELTEVDLITDPTQAAKSLGQIRSQQARTSIDGFGTGYSSMVFLRDMPVDEFKIDRSFVTTMLTDQRNGVLVKAMIGLGRRLGLTVVAEGVEDEQTLAALVALGCPVAQGHHISRPLPAAELCAWVDQRRPVASAP